MVRPLKKNIFFFLCLSLHNIFFSEETFEAREVQLQYPIPANREERGRKEERKKVSGRNIRLKGKHSKEKVRIPIDQLEWIGGTPYLI